MVNVMRKSFPGVLVVAALFWPLPLYAQQRLNIEAEHERGQALRAERRDAEALDVFRGIYESAHEPRALARMALAEFALQRYEIAEEHLVAALRRRGDGWIDRNRSDLENALRQIQGRLGWLNVTCNVNGAELWISGRRITTLPARQPIRVVAGSVEFEVRANSYQPVHRTVEVRPGATVNSSAELQASQAPPSPPSPPVQPPATESRALPWVVGGTGVAALAASAILYWGPYSRASDEYERQCPDSRCSPSSLNAGRSAASAMGLFSAVAGITLGVGSAATIAGVLWLTTGRNRETSGRAMAVSLIPGSHGALFVAGGSF